MKHPTKILISFLIPRILEHEKRYFALFFYTPIEKEKVTEELCANKIALDSS